MSRIIDDARGKIAREIFGICCPGYEFHDEEMYLDFADQILTISGTTDIECPNPICVKGKIDALLRKGKCYWCNGTGKKKIGWKVSVTLENGKLPVNPTKVTNHFGLPEEEVTFRNTSNDMLTDLVQQDMLNAKYRQVVE